mmetsp:Transcript_86172/g.238887  ORF Transcript_86172/g.238887 Transcript_86172/m.238887 type:complete len:422 (+) Transcript_86172:89-1354(+)
MRRCLGNAVARGHLLAIPRPVLLHCPPRGQSAAVNARCSALAQGGLTQVPDELDELLLEGPPGSVERRVGADHVQAHALLVHEVLRVREESCLPVGERLVAVHPRGERHPGLVHRSVGPRCIGQAVDKVSPHEHLQQVPRLTARASPTPELRSVQAMLLSQLDDLARNSANFIPWHIKALQEVLEDVLEGHVLATVARVEDLGNTHLRARGHERAHGRDAHFAEAGVVIPVLVHKLAVKLIDQRPSIGNVVEPLAEYPWQRCLLGPEPEQNVGNSRLHLVEERREGVGVVEGGPLATEFLFVLLEHAEAPLRMQVPAEILREGVLGRSATLALRTVGFLLLPQSLRRALGPGLSPAHGDRVQQAEPAPLSGQLICLCRPVVPFEIHDIVLPVDLHHERAHALAQMPEGLLSLVCFEIVPAA